MVYSILIPKWLTKQMGNGVKTIWKFTLVTIKYVNQATETHATTVTGISLRPHPQNLASQATAAHEVVFGFVATVWVFKATCTYNLEQNLWNASGTLISCLIILELHSVACENVQFQFRMGPTGPDLLQTIPSTMTVALS